MHIQSERSLQSRTKKRLRCLHVKIMNGFTSVTPPRLECIAGLYAGRYICLRRADKCRDSPSKAKPEDQGDYRKAALQDGCIACRQPPATWRTDGESRQVPRQVLETDLRLHEQRALQHRQQYSGTMHKAVDRGEKELPLLRFAQNGKGFGSLSYGHCHLPDEQDIGFGIS